MAQSQKINESDTGRSSSSTKCKSSSNGFLAKILQTASLELKRANIIRSNTWHVEAKQAEERHPPDSDVDGSSSSSNTDKTVTPSTILLNEKTEDDNSFTASTIPSIPSTSKSSLNIFRRVTMKRRHTWKVFSGDESSTSKKYYSEQTRRRRKKYQSESHAGTTGLYRTTSLDNTLEEFDRHSPVQEKRIICYSKSLEGNLSDQHCEKNIEQKKIRKKSFNKKQEKCTLCPTNSVPISVYDSALIGHSESIICSNLENTDIDDNFLPVKDKHKRKTKSLLRSISLKMSNKSADEIKTSDNELTSKSFDQPNLCDTSAENPRNLTDHNSKIKKSFFRRLLFQRGDKGWRSMVSVAEEPNSYLSATTGDTNLQMGTKFLGLQQIPEPKSGNCSQIASGNESSQILSTSLVETEQISASDEGKLNSNLKGNPEQLSSGEFEKEDFKTTQGRVLNPESQGRQTANLPPQIVSIYKVNLLVFTRLIC